MAREVVIHRIEILRNKKRFGQLWVGKRFIEWKPVHGRLGKMTWDKLTEYMKNHPV